MTRPDLSAIMWRSDHGWLDKGRMRRGMLYAYKEPFCPQCAQHS